jgi:hypothetical protein
MSEITRSKSLSAAIVKPAAPLECGLDRCALTDQKKAQHIERILCVVHNPECARTREFAGRL